MSASSPSSSSQVMGCHEEWTFTTNTSYSSGGSESHGSQELDQLKFEVAHAKWHTSLYRAALLDVEGGIEAAAVQLEKVKVYRRPHCAECKEHHRLADLAAAGKCEMDTVLQNSPVLCSSTPKKRARIQRREERSMST